MSDTATIDPFAALAEPIPPDEVKHREQGEKTLSYITAHVVMNRLDAVVGPTNWEFSLAPWGSDLIGTLSLRTADGAWVSKSDVGGRAGMREPDNDAKSAASDALKRCGVLWGIGRELKEDEAPAPAAAPPAPPPRKARHDWPGAAAPANVPGPRGAAPRTGKALFAWVRAREQEFGSGLLKYLNSWARLQEFPGRMVDWSAEQVAEAYAEACRKLQAEDSGVREGVQSS